MKEETLGWGRYELMRPKQIEQVFHRAPVAYIPWGALEWHSYHNPIGLDGMQAHGQCVALAKVTGGVVLPPIYAGTDTIKPFKGFPHTIEHSANLIEQLCLEFLRQLAGEGFRVIVIVTGHCGAGHTEALQRAVDAFEQTQSDTHIRLVPSFTPTQDIYPSNHAARGETSYQLHYGPDLVDLDQLPADRTATLDEDGVWGEDPRLATANEGAAIEKLFVRRLAPEIIDLL